MIMSFLVSTSDNKIHLVEHDTNSIGSDIDREWQRWMDANPNRFTSLIPTIGGFRNPFDTPALVGALLVEDGTVRWFDGEGKKHWENNDGNDAGS